MCSPFLPRFTWVSDVAAQPATASMAINIKIRFITVLMAARSLLLWSACIRSRLKRSEIPVRKNPYLALS
jgi:hypothetical protein